MADLNQTPERPEWACPCSGCTKAIAWERKQLIKEINRIKREYQEYRGSSFHKDTGELLWMKDDVEAYSEGMDEVIKLIEERMPKTKVKK